MSSTSEQLEDRGYGVIPGVYGAAEVARALALTRAWHEQGQAAVSRDVPFLNRDQPMVYNLQNKDRFFLELLFGCEAVQALLRHFLNDPWYKGIPAGEANYILRSYLARSSAKTLPMHIDSFVPYTGSHVFSMQVSILLEDHDEESGCTMVVPGSHRRGEYTTQAALAEAVPIRARAGDVVLWDSRLWHGARANAGGGTRWALIATFVRWWLKQAFDIPRNLPQAIYETLTDSQKAVLGFCALPFADETQGIDMKRGYACLPERVSDLP